MSKQESRFYQKETIPHPFPPVGGQGSAREGAPGGIPGGKLSITTSLPG